ncbi:PREDICTED: uncharacterized protein LOC106807500 [Priapulus caudatus]|uniref:Uncharacterized protein LOC106807500 n=1 Tax=Priapulus caudatus TaxID=37621 RepID=A0ABM1DZF3_PRICU|nr:PREDICTED: uncharacterized protein LOC106807500 [Priapulus caudatus]
MNLPTIFKTRGSFEVTECHPTYKVLYLGNVQTVMAKGDNCTDKPLKILWKNYEKKGAGAKMKLSVCTSGMEGVTKEQGVTHYWSHRITYCITHPRFPRLFCWIYRHEGKKMKVELRCHAVLCKKEAIAKALTVQLHEATTAALKEFMLEKLRRQNYRLLLNSKVGFVATVPRRKQILSAAKNFKPPIEKSRSAPRLKSIDETPLEEDEHCLENGSTTFQQLNHRLAHMRLQEALLEEAEEGDDDDDDVFLDAVLGNGSLPSAAIERQTLPAVEAEKLPVIERQTLPAVKAEKLPAVEGQLLPAVEENKLPAVEGHLLPVVEAEKLPAVEGQLLLAVEAEKLLAVDGHLLPAVEGHPLPAVEGHPLPAVEGQLLPAVEAEHLPVVERQTLPAVEAEKLLAVEGYLLPAVEGQQLPEVEGDLSATVEGDLSATGEESADVSSPAVDASDVDTCRDSGTGSSTETDVAELLAESQIADEECFTRVDPRPVPPPRRRRKPITRHLSLEKYVTEEQQRRDVDTVSLTGSLGSADVVMECGNDIDSFKEDESVKCLLLGESSSSPEPGDDDDDDDDNISDESGYSEGDWRPDANGTVIRICPPDKVLHIKLNGVSSSCCTGDNQVNPKSDEIRSISTTKLPSTKQKNRDSKVPAMEQNNRDLKVPSMEQNNRDLKVPLMEQNNSYSDDKAGPYPCVIWF